MIMIVQQATCVTVKIDAKGEQCFFETVTKPDVKLQVQFQVSSGGFLDIDFRLLSPNGDLVHSIERETEGKFTFTAPTTGDYQICFSNSMSTLTPKIVSFDVHVGDLLDPHLTKIGTFSGDSLTPSTHTTFFTPVCLIIICSPFIYNNNNYL